MLRAVTNIKLHELRRCYSLCQRKNYSSNLAADADTKNGKIWCRKDDEDERKVEIMFSVGF
jgi:hypothetical protein